MTDFEPSYSNYKEILRRLKSSGKLCSYEQALKKEKFIVLRHDIEFSVGRAYQMSLLESEEGIVSTYFVQMKNNAYNPFSEQNMKMLKDMHKRGHEIGLHYHIGESKDPAFVQKETLEQCRILQNLLGIPVKTYSMHRPQKETRYYETDVPGYINAYSKAFFTFVESVDENTVFDVKYIADSQHRWNYGYPDEETLCNTPKIQLLIHPDFWTESGQDVLGNFKQLITENMYEYMNTLDNECKHYRSVKNQLQKELLILFK